MKQILFSIAFFLVMALSVSAQPLLYTGEMGPDTVNASETIYHYPNGTSFATARRFRDLGALETLVRGDSLSGATNVAVTIQYAYDILGTEWYDVATGTINGASPVYIRTEDSELTATWFRVKYVAPAGAQATKVQSVYSFKKRL